MGHKVLIVDDEEEVRVILAHEFKRHGCDVLLAEDGQKALEIVKANRIDMILTDLRMPKMGGIELTETVDAMPEDERPIVITMTGYVKAKESDVIDSGASGFLSKPFSRDQIKEIVDEFLSLIPIRSEE